MVIFEVSKIIINDEYMLTLMCRSKLTGTNLKNSKLIWLRYEPFRIMLDKLICLQFTLSVLLAIFLTKLE